MVTSLGILVLLIGVAFPMGMLVWLNGRMRRPPALQSQQVGMILALNGILPLCLVLGGLWLIFPPLGSSPAFKGVIIASGLVVLVLMGGLWRIGRAAKQRGGSDGG